MEFQWITWIYFVHGILTQLGPDGPGPSFIPTYSVYDSIRTFASTHRQIHVHVRDWGREPWTCLFAIKSCFSGTQIQITAGKERSFTTLFVPYLPVLTASLWGWTFNVWHTDWTWLVLLIRMVHIWNRDHILLFAWFHSGSPENLPVSLVLGTPGLCRLMGDSLQ